MKYIPRWLAERLSQPKKPVEDDQPSNPESDEDDTTVPDPEILDPDSSDSDKSTESDPDNTVKM